MDGRSQDGTGACSCKVNDLGHRLLQAGCPVLAHTAGLRALALSPCGQKLASGDEDGVVILWDAHTGEAERRMERAVGEVFHIEGASRVNSLSFSGEGARLASGNSDNSIRVWDVTSGFSARFRLPEITNT